MERPNNLTWHVEPSAVQVLRPCIPSYLPRAPITSPHWSSFTYSYIRGNLLPQKCHIGSRLCLAGFLFHSSELCSNISSSEKDRFSLTSLTITIHPLHLFSVFLDLYWVPLFDIFGPSCSFIVVFMIASL